MTTEDTIAARDLRLVTRTGTTAVGSFLIVSWLTTQVESIRSALPFTEDPYDAIVSFAVVGIAVVGGATLVRAIGHLRRPYDASAARRIAIGAAIATVIAAVAVVSDVVAMILAPADLGAPGVTVVLGILGITAGMTVVALACIGRARSALLRVPAMADTEPDIIDEIGSIAGSVGAARMADGFAGWVERSPVSPRRHRVLAGILGGAAAGVAAVAWHAIREGPWASPVAAAVFGILTTLGVAGAYFVCLAPLRLLRTPRHD